VAFTVNGETKKTDAKGVACFDGLPWSGTGTKYVVEETVPSGYEPGLLDAWTFRNLRKNLLGLAQWV
jgi:hypothetical protein